MISKLLANISEELLLDLFRAVVRELLLKRNKEVLGKAVDQIEQAVTEWKQTEGVDDEEEIQKLIAAGRVAVQRMRDRK